MNFKLNKKSISNIVFVIAIGVLLYPPSRESFMRQIAFAPSVTEVEKSEKLSSYDWDLKGLNAESINFKELENKVVFVNFWTTWCPPCRAELPMIQKLYADYKDKVAFVFVTNEDWPKVQEFFNKNNYDLPAYNAVSAPPNSFTETNSIPATYLIDKKGNILIAKTGSADWNSRKIRNLLDELVVQ